MPHPPPDLFADEVLMVRIARQDQAALSDLYDRYVRILFGMAYKILNSREEAEEVVLDVFSQVWRTAANYDPGRSRVDSWLFLITRSRSVDRLRTLKRASRPLTAYEQTVREVPPWSASPEEVLLLRERRDQVIASLNALPPEQQQVLELAYFSNLTQAEIASRLNIPVGTVKTRIRLGIAKLREAFRDGRLI
jgi:RNA polymerase sigma-70 factor (ECF subfamily)